MFNELLIRTLLLRHEKQKNTDFSAFCDQNCLNDNDLIRKCLAADVLLYRLPKQIIIALYGL